MTESAGEFIVEIKNLKATDLTSRNRFKEKLKIEGEFDNFRFKTSKVLIGGGDINWKYNWKQNYQVHSISELEQRFLRLKCFRSKADLYGSLQLDLWTIATGPVDHNLPLLDADKKVVGRLHFSCEMRQIASVTVQFKEVKMKNLPYPANHSECNPYLKYGYSKNWLAIQDGKMKAHYSQVRYHTTNPVWADDLPEIRFSTSLKELLHESIVLHVTHKGKIHNTTIGRCNLLFRTLVDNGKGFKDDDLISFKGPLKIDRAEIEGTLIFKYLPKLAQMKPVNAVKRAIHNENGIYDAMPLLPNLPVPKQTVHVSDEKTQISKVKAQDDIKHTPTSTRKNGLADKNLLRNAINSPSVSKAVNESDSDDDSDDDDDTTKTKGRSDSVVKGEREETKEEKEKRRKERRERRERRRERRERKNSLNSSTTATPTMTVDDLIMFSPPVATRNRANTFSAHSSYSGAQSQPHINMNNNVNTYAQHESFVPSMYALNHSMNNVNLGFNDSLGNSSDNIVPHHIKPSGSYNIVDKQEYATYSPQSFPSLVVSKSKSMTTVPTVSTDSYNPFLPSSDPQYQQQQQLQQQSQQTQPQQYKEMTNSEPINPFGTPNLPQAPILFMNQQQNTGMQNHPVQQQPQPQ